MPMTNSHDQFTHSRSDGHQILNIPILMYHDIRTKNDPNTPLAVSLSSFNRQLDQLQAWGFNTITFESLYCAMQGGPKLPKKPVILTFDDGYQSFHSRVWPICKERGLTATVFLLANKFGHEWFPNVPLMTVEQAKEVIEGGMEAGVHGWEHKRLMEITEEELRQEIISSRHRLMELFNAPLKTYCYAYGKFSPAFFTHLQEAGYLGAVSILSPWRKVTQEPLAMRRIQVHDHDLDMRLFLKMTPLYMHYLGFKQA